MKIDEMRELHRRAQTDDAARRTVLRLVLASRYREVVGSSDQVLQMKARSNEQHELLLCVPQLLSRLEASIESQVEIQQHIMTMVGEQDSGELAQ